MCILTLEGHGSVGHQMMSPIQPWYSNASLWCNDSSGVAFANNQVPRQLTPGLCLICGDCAWAGLPSNMMGGPCTIRHLTMVAPNFSMVADMTCSLHRGRRVTRSLRHRPHALYSFDQEYKDDMQFWGKRSGVVASIFAPTVAAAKALAMLDKLGCWLAKNTNETSEALAGLLTDVRSVRHAVAKSCSH